MKNLRLYETEALYTSDPIKREYPTVSYCKETDTIYFVKYSAFEFVDLGLPSGTLWADRNVGATKPEKYGLYFQWGDTQGYTGITDEKQFTKGDYKWSSDADGDTMTKYNGTDGLVTLESADDAAIVVDKGCRMPTKEECDELKANTTSEWIADYNGTSVNGMLFTSNSNGNSIFIPAAGVCYDGSIRYARTNGKLWSSSLGSLSVEAANILTYKHTGFVGVGPEFRRYGIPVRPVKK